jgi:maleylacetate reductase
LTADFTWRDAGRTVVFRQGGAAAADAILAEHGFAGFELLSTERALAGAGELAGVARAVHAVGPGLVSDLAGELLETVGEGPFVALGGGRVIDVAKGVAGVRGARLAAVPTTMSGAEMTASHRAPGGGHKRVEGGTRPSLVIADPEAMTSAPEEELRASSMNALAHGADTLYLPLSNPVSEMTALRGAALIAAALDRDPPRRDRSELALGSLLCGYAIDSAGMGLHHLVCQTRVVLCGTPHAGTNAAVLPHSVAFLAARAPAPYAAFAEAIGTDLDGLGPRIEAFGRPRGLGELGGDRDRIEEAIEAMLQRSELAYVPEPPGREELRELVLRAW